MIKKKTALPQHMFHKRSNSTSSVREMKSPTLKPLIGSKPRSKSRSSRSNSCAAQEPPKLSVKRKSEFGGRTGSYRRRSRKESLSRSSSDTLMFDLRNILANRIKSQLLFNSEDAAQHFKMFLTREHATELLNFLSAASSYYEKWFDWHNTLNAELQKHPNNEEEVYTKYKVVKTDLKDIIYTDEMKKQANNVYHKYLSEEAKDQISMEASVAKKINRALKAGKYGYDMYNKAIKQVCIDMESDMAVRFVRSPEYRSLMDVFLSSIFKQFKLLGFVKVENEQEKKVFTEDESYHLLLDNPLLMDLIRQHLQRFDPGLLPLILFHIDLAQARKSRKSSRLTKLKIMTFDYYCKMGGTLKNQLDNTKPTRPVKKKSDEKIKELTEEQQKMARMRKRLAEKRRKKSGGRTGSGSSLLDMMKKDASAMSVALVKHEALREKWQLMDPEKPDLKIFDQVKEIILKEIISKVFPNFCKSYIFISLCTALLEHDAQTIKLNHVLANAEYLEGYKEYCKANELDKILTFYLAIEEFKKYYSSTMKSFGLQSSKISKVMMWLFQNIFLKFIKTGTEYFIDTGMRKKLIESTINHYKISDKGKMKSTLGIEAQKQDIINCKRIIFELQDRQYRSLSKKYSGFTRSKFYASCVKKLKK